MSCSGTDPCLFSPSAPGNPVTSHSGTNRWFQLFFTGPFWWSAAGTMVGDTLTLSSWKKCFGVCALPRPARRMAVSPCYGECDAFLRGSLYTHAHMKEGMHTQEGSQAIRDSEVLGSQLQKPIGWSIRRWGIDFLPLMCGFCALLSPQGKIDFTPLSPSKPSLLALRAMGCNPQHSHFFLSGLR